MCSLPFLSLPPSERCLVLILSFHLAPPPCHSCAQRGRACLGLSFAENQKINHARLSLDIACSFVFVFVFLQVAAAAVLFLSFFRSIQSLKPLLAYRVKKPPPNNNPTATKGARMLTTAMITCGSTMRSARSFFSRLDLKYSSGSLSRVGREGGPSNNLLLLLRLWLEEKEEEEKPRAIVTGRAVLVLIAGRKPAGLKAATRPHRQAKARAQRKATERDIMG